MKSYIKLYGPSLSKAQAALKKLVKELDPIQYGSIVSTIDPGMDLLTSSMIKHGRELLGEYDFVFEWIDAPSAEQIDKLTQKIDEALAPTGCRYTITTK